MQKFLTGVLVVIWLTSFVGLTACTCQKPSTDGNDPNNAETEYPITDNDEWITVSIIAAKNAAAVPAAGSQQQIRSMAERNEYYRVSAENSIDYIDAFGNVKTAQDGVCRIGAEPSKQVFVKLLKLCSDLSLMENCLTKKGIEAVPREAAVISITGYPLVLRIECDDSVLFITVGTESNSQNSLFIDGYCLDVYSQQEYSELLQPKKITVFVNGVKADLCDALLLGDFTKIPVVCILKQLDENTMLFYDNGQPMLLLKDNEYSIIPEEHSLTLKDGKRNIIELPPGCFGICEVSGDELYVDEAAFSDILSIVDARAVFERDSLCLLIETTQGA